MSNVYDTHRKMYSEIYMGKVIVKRTASFDATCYQEFKDGYIVANEGGKDAFMFTDRNGESFEVITLHARRVIQRMEELKNEHT